MKGVAQIWGIESMVVSPFLVNSGTSFNLLELLGLVVWTDWYKGWEIALKLKSVLRNGSCFFLIIQEYINK